MSRLFSESISVTNCGDPRISTLITNFLFNASAEKAATASAQSSGSEGNLTQHRAYSFAYGGSVSVPAGNDANLVKSITCLREVILREFAKQINKLEIF